MKYLSFLSIVFALLVSSFAFAPTNNEDGILFHEISFDEALAKAKKENKLIFMDAYAEWCGPCKILARTTFKSEKIGEVFNKNFINVKMDMEKGEGPQLARRFQVTAYPTLFLINSEGKVVKRMLGLMGEEQLMTHVKEYVK